MHQPHEILRAFGRHHGEIFNTAAVARTLATTRLEVGRHLRRLRGAGYLRLLPSLPQPCPADVIRRPRMYLRTRAWKHAFAGVMSPSGCLRVPIQADLAARATEGVIERETTRRRSGSFHSMGRYRRRGIDLVVARPSGWRIGFSFEPRATDRKANKAIEALAEAVAARWINLAILVTCGGVPGYGRCGVLCLPAPLLLAMYHHWTSEHGAREGLPSLLEWIGNHREIVVGMFAGPAEPWGLDADYVAVEEEFLETVLPRPP